MKNMKRLISSLALALYGLSIAANPQLPENCTVFRPELLNSYTVKKTELDALVSPNKKKQNTWGQDGANTGAYWVVFSDRSNNTTYELPSKGSLVCSKLDFNEKVIIASINNGYALVYEEKQSGTTYPQISRHAICKGWVPMKNLLLWSECPTNEYGIYNKALIVANIDEAKNNSHIGYIYTNPSTFEGKKELVSSMNFFFVMKTDESGLVLLAKESRVGGKMKDVLYGWVSPGMYAPWSQRTCLEPNWQLDVVDQLRGTRIPVLNKNGQLATNIEIGAKKYNVANNPALAYRQDPHILRYPLLENDRGKNRYFITAFANTDESSAISNMEAVAKGEAGIENALEELHKVNLILVIDGSYGMAKFFPAALEAIKRAYDYFGKDNRTVRVGIVIYRDYADGKFVTEHLSMRSPMDPSVAQFLRTGGTYGVKSSPSDKTDADALYKGLEVALDTKTMGYTSKNSNLMFVIGDCGNDLNDKQCLSKETIINKCVENRIQLSSFQVRNIQSKSYLQFRSQMSEISRENMERQYAKLGSGLKHDYKELPDGYDFNYKVSKESHFFIGGFRFAESGKEMDVTRLYALVRSTSERFNDAMVAQEGKIVKAPEILSDGAYSSIDKKFIEGYLSRAEIDAIKKGKYLTAFQGYVNQKSPGKWDYWKPVIYISHPEYKTLIGELKKVMDNTQNNPDDRKAYVDAMKALVRTMLPDISEADMNNMDNKDIMERIMGLNVRTDALERHKLIDIQSEAKVSKPEFDGLIADFQEHYRKLEAIQNTAYPFSIKRNGVKWYWIPAEDLP